MIIIMIGVRRGLGASIFIISNGCGPRKEVAQFLKVLRWVITKFVILFQFWILLEEKNDEKNISGNTTYLSDKGHKNK
jgi:hypothetical protein